MIILKSIFGGTGHEFVDIFNDFRKMSADSEQYSEPIGF
jgi:hypothetical protein